MYINVCTICAKNSTYNVKSDYGLLAAKVGRSKTLGDIIVQSRLPALTRASSSCTLFITYFAIVSEEREQ